MSDRGLRLNVPAVRALVAFMLFAVTFHHTIGLADQSLGFSDILAHLRLTRLGLGGMLRTTFGARPIIHLTRVCGARDVEGRTPSPLMTLLGVICTDSVLISLT